MDVLILATYAFLVWLVYFKFKWLPWTTPHKVTVFTIPVVGMTALILLLNIFAPSSADVRVLNYVVQIVPQVRGRVVEVAVDGNRPVKKGDLLFRIDPTPYENDVRVLEAKLAAEEAKLIETRAGVAGAEGGSREIGESLKAAAGKVAAVQAKIRLARMRVAQNRDLTQSGAGDAFSLEQADSTLLELEAELASARASEAQVKQKISARYGGDLATVAAAKAQEAALRAQRESTRAELENARWELTQTQVYAPADGWVINLQLRPGSFVAPLPLTAVMSFVEEQHQVIALYNQNELHRVAQGNEAELALRTLPGRVLKAKVESIVWAQGQGQLALSGMLPQTGVAPQAPGRFAVKLDLEDKHRDVFLAAGAGGDAAIYTDGLGAIHIVRKVILRVGSYTNYIIPKLH
jgi:multidrug resistance efflux pump